MRKMRASLEEALREVCRQALVENARSVQIGEKSYPVRRTPKSGLRQVDFEIEGEGFCGLAVFSHNG
jgi:hypothetical protein